MLESLYLHFVKHARFSSRGESAIFAGTIYMLSYILFNYIFIVKDRDLKIFGKYEEISNRDPKRNWHLILSLSVLMLPYVVLLSFAVFFPRH